MVIGNGQLAKKFKNVYDNSIYIFASGVSNSNTTDIKEFEREKNLLIDSLQKANNKKFVYFSSCALSASEYPKNDYYIHKKEMENVIKNYSCTYYIFRIPQLFGDLILHRTLINFIYKSIEHNHKFNIYNEAFRYVIEINDLQKLVEIYLSNHNSCITVDLANPYRYKVLDIVNMFEKLLNKKANYKLIDKEDQYILDLSSMERYLANFNIDLSFGKDYLLKKLEDKLI